MSVVLLLLGVTLLLVFGVVLGAGIKKTERKDEEQNNEKDE